LNCLSFFDARLLVALFVYSSFSLNYFLIKQSYSTREKSLKISKGQSEDIDERRTYNSMAITKKDMMTTKVSGVPEVI